MTASPDLPEAKVESSYVKINDWGRSKGLDSDTVAFIVRKGNIHVGRIGSVKMALKSELDSGLNALVVSQSDRREEKKIKLKAAALARKKSQQIGGLAIALNVDETAMLDIIAIVSSHLEEVPDDSRRLIDQVVANFGNSANPPTQDGKNPLKDRLEKVRGKKGS